MPPPPRLGATRLDHVLGRGASGVVWAGTFADPFLGRVPVAVKVLAADKLTDDARARFAREVRAVAALSHPGIVEALDTGVVPAGLAGLQAGAPYLVMRRAEADLAHRPPARRWDAVEEVVVQVLEALAHAHARGVLHRDLKPGNLLWMGGQRVVLADFGISFVLGDRAGAEGWGTPAFMAPEQLADGWGEEGPRTDLYGFGCVVRWMLTGRAPFDRPEQRLVERAPELGPGVRVPRGVRRWLQRLLEPDPADRFADAAHALAALDDPDAPSVQPAPRRWPLQVDLGSGVRQPLSTSLAAVRSVPLIGHAVARACMWEHLREVVENGRPQVVQVVGEPGLGRRKLARSLGLTAVELGVAVHHEVQCGPEAGGLVGAFPALSGLRSRVARASALAVELARSGRPVVLHLVDPGADPDDLAVIAHLVERAALPVLVVATLAQVAEQAGPAVRLDPVEDADLSALLLGTFGLSGAAADWLRDRADGNPGFLVQLVREAAARGLLRVGADGLVLDDAEGLPAGLVGAWRARLTRVVPAEDRRGVQLLALIHTEVHPDLWGRIAAVAGVEASRKILQNLLQHGVLVESGQAVRFAHPMVRAAAAELCAADTRVLHAAAAEVLSGQTEPDRIARHLLAAGRDRLALRPMRQAAIAALDVQRVWRTQRWIDQHAAAIERLGLPESDEAHGWSLYLRSRAADTGGLGEVAWATAEELEARAPGHGWHRLHARALARRAFRARREGRVDEAVEAYAAARKRADALGMDELVCSIAEGWGWLELARGRHADAARAFSEGIERAMDTPVGRANRRTCLRGVGLAELQAGHPERALVWLDKALAAAVQDGAALSEASTLNCLGDAARALGRLGEAERAYQAAIELYATVGSNGVMATRLNQAIVCLLRKEADRAAPLLQRVMDHYRHVGQAPLLVIALAADAVRAALAGDPVTARTRLDAATRTVPGFVDVDLAGVYVLLARGSRGDLSRDAWRAAAAQWTALGRDEAAAEAARFGGLVG